MDDTSQIILGRRIRFFREMAKLSQFQLENMVGISNGQLSRFESGQVNPTKETILKIAEVLELTNKELEYLSGILINPASNEEITKVIKLTENYFNKNGIFAYILDDRWRLIDCSKSFLKVFAIDEKMKQTLTGRTMIEIMFNENLPTHKLILGKTFKELARAQLSKFYYETSFMIDDPYVQQSYYWIKNNKAAFEVWEEILNNKGLRLHTLSSRTVTFNINGLSFKMSFAREPVPLHPRFEVIEYIPTNKILKFLAKLM